MSHGADRPADGRDRPRPIPSMIGQLHDVDVSTTPPVDGDTLIAGSDKIWTPGGESAGGGRVNGARDRYTIASTVTTVYGLSFTPRKNTLNLFLNGLALDEGVDYTVDYGAPSITLTAAASRAVGDVLWARYLTTNASATQAPTTLVWGVRSDTAAIIGTFDAVALIGPATPFTDISAHLDPGAGELDLVFGCSSFFNPTVDCDYLFLRSGHDLAYQPGLWHFTRVSGVDSDTLITSITALIGAADYSVSLSGTTLTTKRNGTTVDTTTLTGSDAAALSNTIVGLRGTHGTSIAVTNFSADAGTVTDAFTRPDADQLGAADTGQSWVGTS